MHVHVLHMHFYIVGYFLMFRYIFFVVNYTLLIVTKMNVLFPFYIHLSYLNHHRYDIHYPLLFYLILFYYVNNIYLSFPNLLYLYLLQIALSMIDSCIIMLFIEVFSLVRYYMNL